MNYELPMVLSVEKVSEILNISKSVAYDLINQNTIPHKRVGRRIIIPTKKFMSWLNNTES